jgi:hypothetical protein
MRGEQQALHQPAELAGRDPTERRENAGAARRQGFADDQQILQPIVVLLLERAHRGHEHRAGIGAFERFAHCGRTMFGADREAIEVRRDALVQLPQMSQPHVRGAHEHRPHLAQVGGLGGVLRQDPANDRRRRGHRHATRKPTTRTTFCEIAANTLIRPSIALLWAMEPPNAHSSSLSTNTNSSAGYARQRAGGTGATP